MGTSFVAQDAPTKYQRATWIPESVSGDELVALGLYRGADGHVFEEVSCAPEVDVSQESARIILALAGMAHLDSVCGMLEGEQLRAFHAELLKSRNAYSTRRPFQVDTLAEGNVICCGYDDARILRLLDRMIALSHYCQRHSLPLSWA